MGYKLVGIFGLILIILGNFLTLKKKLRIKYTYYLLLFGGISLLIYSISISDMIFIILQSLFIIMSFIEIILVNKK